MFYFVNFEPLTFPSTPASPDTAYLKLDEAENFLHFSLLTWTGD